MEKLAYHLLKVYCSYNDKDVVLEIPDLELHKGKLYFLIGKSGVGKSTLIETLGLMNETIHKDSQQCVFFDELNNRIDLIKIWNSKLEEQARIRKQYFSFIFQDSSLMQNFTVGENVCLSLLLENRNPEEIKPKILSYMKDLDLSPELYDRTVQELSVGQRQRLAFVRAFIAPFDILFGDEPTGNLDPISAQNVLNMLSDHLVKHHKTGIIVSHDIKLALDFADEIIYIKPIERNNRVIGNIKNENKIIRKNDSWVDYAGNPIKDANTFLHEVL